jgi:hypothetical protein
LAGLFDANGSISLSSFSSNKEIVNLPGLYGKVQRLIYSKGNNQCIIKCTNKNKNNIELFLFLNIGNLYFEKNKKNQIKWH